MRDTRCRVVRFGEPNTGNVWARFPVRSENRPRSGLPVQGATQRRADSHQCDGRQRCDGQPKGELRAHSRLTNTRAGTHHRGPLTAHGSSEASAVLDRGGAVPAEVHLDRVPRWLGGRRSVAGALTGRAASVASPAAVLAIAAAVDSGFATSVSAQPKAKECDRTLQVRGAIVAPTDTAACSND